MKTYYVHIYIYTRIQNFFVIPTIVVNIIILTHHTHDTPGMYSPLTLRDTGAAGAAGVAGSYRAEQLEVWNEEFLDGNPVV